ncbi:MAG: hypothetical protein Q9209_001444 [Squamulea sp. 1 TL-2023]
MNFKMYTSDKTSERGFPWLWFVRLLQMLVTVIVLAITASNASDFTSLSCSVPSKLGYNIAARDQSPAPKGLAGSIEERAYYRHNGGPGSSKKNAKVAFDAIMVILFAFTTAATIFYILKNRRSGTAATSTNPADPSTKQSGGLAPTPVPGFYASDGKDTTHIENSPQVAPYPPQQTQPQMQQSGFPEPTQQSTYPTANPQGTAGDYYDQSRGQQQQMHYPPNRAEMPSPPPQQHDVSPIAGH